MVRAQKEMLTLKLEESVKMALESACYSDGLTLSECVRRLIREYLKSKGFGV
ncbi:MAG: hypothetical protein QXG57_08460 [Thermofilaceae archaeon]